MQQRQLVILSRTSYKNGVPDPIGSRVDVVNALAMRNTLADIEGGDILYGPGVDIQLPPGQDPIQQMLLTITDEDIAWPVILRLAKDLQWKLLDPVSARELTPP